MTASDTYVDVENDISSPAAKATQIAADAARQAAKAVADEVTVTIGRSSAGVAAATDYTKRLISAGTAVTREVQAAVGSLPSFTPAVGDTASAQRALEVSTAAFKNIALTSLDVYDGAVAATVQSQRSLIPAGQVGQVGSWAAFAESNVRAVSELNIAWSGAVRTLLS